MKYKLLKEVARITMGQSPDSSSYNNEKDGLPFFQGNADFGEIYPNERVWCNNPKKTAEPGDILISVRAPIGALNYAKDRCCIGRGLAAIAIDDEADSNYIFHLLKARNIELNNQGTGSTFKAIGKSVLEDLKVPQIPKEDQQRCIKMIDLLESDIRKRRMQLDLLDELIKARFVEMFGDITNNSLNLKEVTVVDCCKMTQGTQIPMADQISEYQEGYYRYLYIRDLKYDNDDWIYVRDQYDEKKLTERDLVVVNTGNTAGEIYRGKDGILSNNLFKVSFDSELLLPTYLFYYFRSEAFQKMLWSEMKEGTQPHLGHKIFGSKKLLIPQIYAQKQFADFVNQVDKSKVAIQKSLDETQLLFDSLMQEFFK